MIRAATCAGFLGMLLVPAQTASADPTKAPTADFTAEVSEKLGDFEDDEPTVDRVYHSGWRYRRDVNPEVSVILDCPKERAYSLLLKSKSYKAFPLARAECDPINFYLGWNPKAERIGEEEINSVAAVKYRVTGWIQDQLRYEATVWTTKENIVVKTIAAQYSKASPNKPVSRRLELRDLRIGPVDPKLFEIPADFRKDE